MKLLVQLSSESILFEFRPNGLNSSFDYTLRTPEYGSGQASIRQVRPNLYSILNGSRSFTVYVAPRGPDLEVWVDTTRYYLSLADVRDVSPEARGATAKGPSRVSTQMPGKVVRVLVEPGARVTAGQALIVVEAMKMQNELRAPRAGIVSRITAAEGLTVAANQPLVIIE